MIRLARWCVILVGLVYPLQCPGCKENVPSEAEGMLCKDCWNMLPRLSPPLCPSCGRQLPMYESKDALCDACSRSPHPFKYTLACGPYEGLLKRLGIRVAECLEHPVHLLNIMGKFLFSQCPVNHFRNRFRNSRILFSKRNRRVIGDQQHVI